ncbi:MAG TPA: hypothetical protein VGM93_14815 [Acidimicrobiales bacterium]|jgi:hypothetical protein
MTEPSGVRVWLPVVAGIGLWIVHLSSLSALTRHSCIDPGSNWIAHAVTAVTAILTVVAMGFCEALRRRGARSESSGAPDSDLGPSLVFIGWLGLATGAFSLALILYEGSWAVWVSPCHA